MNYRACSNTAKETSNEVPCASIETLREIWDKKEYRILPHAVLRHLISNKTLSELDKTIWMWLYTEAYFKENWCIQIPRYILAEFFGKNERTISRSTKVLQSQGYLEVSHEGHYATYAVRLPKAIADFIVVNTPDRKPAQSESVQKECATSHEKNVVSLEGVVRSTRDKFVTFPGTAMSATQDKSVNHLILNNNINTNNNTTVAEIIHHAVEPVPNPIVVCFENKKFQESPEIHSALSSPSTLSEKISDVEKQIAEINEQFRQKPNFEVSRQLLFEYRRLECLKFRWEQQVIQEQVMKKRHQQEKQISDQMNTNPAYMRDKQGDRSVDELNYRRLNHVLVSMGYQGKEQNKLLNEIIYAIRFGSLRVKQGSDKPLLIEHAVNIALKLIRAGRWNRPEGVEQWASQSG